MSYPGHYLLFDHVVNVWWTVPISMVSIVYFLKADISKDGEISL
jgi:hypothetical protein